MERHLKFSSLSKTMYPEDGEKYGRGFNQIDLPILAILAVEAWIELPVQGDPVLPGQQGAQQEDA